RELQGLVTKLEPIDKKLSHALLAQHDYPFGDPPHAIGKPDVKYPRVTDQEREFLVAKYGKSFEKARITPRGWILGDVLKKEDGSIMVKNWEQAKEECKKRGTVLPPDIEYVAIKRDFGSGSPEGYIPQFLHNLDDKGEWSSSSDDGVKAWFFLGRLGGLINGVHDSFHKVRCAVLDPAVKGAGVSAIPE
ncbi:MAG: hypothetical protein ABIQ95_04250, partial [Bdellovibrionia bacterium]